MKATNEKLQLQISTSAKGIEVLAITAGVGNGWEFSAACLQESLPLWEGAECYADHTLDKHSVRDLGGLLNDPAWDMETQWIRATLTPTGPAAAVFVELARAAIDHPDLSVGLSADILMKVDGKTVLQIIKVKSLDAVTHPARGGKFVRVLQAKEGEKEMTEKEKEESGGEAQANLETKALAVVKLINEANSQVQLQEAVKKSDQTLSATCGFLLTAALQASRLPEVVKTRLQKQFEGKFFEPATLQAAIEEAKAEVSALTCGACVAGPGRISGMFSGEDQLKAAVFDLFGEERDADTAAWGVQFADANSLGIINSSGCTFSGACTGKRYSAAMNAVIQTWGGGANYFPGNAAGTTATGGQYA